MGRRCFSAVLAVSAFLCLASGALSAATPSRVGYVEELERTCKPRAEATERVMAGARKDGSRGRDRVAAAKFEAAERIFAGTIRRITQVPRPAADTAPLQSWFDLLGRQDDYLTRIAERLRAGKTIKAQRLLAHFIHAGNLANQTVFAFGFDYCSFKFSRFG
jgi:hypothetical protein